MKKQKQKFSNVVLFSLGQNIYYEKRKNAYSILQLVKRFLNSILYVKIR